MKDSKQQKKDKAKRLRDKKAAIESREFAKARRVRKRKKDKQRRSDYR